MTPLKPGDRVHLKGHPHTPHATGTVRSVDALGVHVLWDDGEVVTPQVPTHLEPAGEPMQTDSNTFKHKDTITQVYALAPGELAVNTFSDQWDVKGTQAVVDNTDAPAIALAILEAAGYDADIDDASSLVNSAMGRLAMHLTTEATKAKEAADREALVAEALELRNVLFDKKVNGWEDLASAAEEKWIAVAKHARTLHGVTK